MSTPTIAYGAFDVFPAPKGAAIHIAAFCAALSRAFGPLDLYTVAPSTPGPVPAGVRHFPLAVSGANLIERVLSFRRQLLTHWDGRLYPIAHIRSLYEGYPLARDKGRFCRRLVYEVNGLPSVELKYHHPAVAEDSELMAKLLAQEAACLEAADLILTPSRVTAAFLTRRGAAPERLRVIPNGFDRERFPYAFPRRDGGLRLLYAGTLAPWQGVALALEALALLPGAVLTIVGPDRRRRRLELLERAARLGVASRVALRDPVSQAELLDLHRVHDACLAPLIPNDRNLDQGCCPLKILESMAAGTPVVAANLPAVAEMTAETALLFKPGSSRSLAEVLDRLAAEPLLARELSRAARARVEQRYTWERAGKELAEAYESLSGPCPSGSSAVVAP